MTVDIVNKIPNVTSEYLTRKKFSKIWNHLPFELTELIRPIVEFLKGG